MSDLPTLLALLARVVEATEGDRELDVDILAALEGGEIGWRMSHGTMESTPYLRRPSSDHVSGWMNAAVPLVTTSVDTVLALIGQRLPGAEVELSMRLPNRPAEALLWGPDFSDHRLEDYWESGLLASPALALLSVLLKAEVARLSRSDRSGQEAT